MMFWLAQAKCGAPLSLRVPLSVRTLWLTLWATVRVRPLSRRQSISRLSLACSCSSWSHAFSSSFYLSRICSNHRHDEASAPFPAPTLELPGGVASPAWTFSTCPSSVFTMEHSCEGWWLPSLEPKSEITFDSPGKRSWKHFPRSSPFCSVALA